MSPIEYIAKGINEGDWGAVCEGYERLTGKALPMPVELPGEVKQAKEAMTKIMEIASSVIGESIVEVAKPSKKRGRPKGSGSKTTKKNTEAKDGDDSTISLDEKQKTAVSKETGGTRLITNEPDPEEVKKNLVKSRRAMINKSQINTERSQTYTVKCNECPNTFQSDRKSGEMGQKCRKCLSDKKGRLA